MASLTVVVQVSLAWLIGSLGTGAILFAVNFFVPINFLTTGLICVAEFYACYLYFRTWRGWLVREKGAKFNIAFENTWKFFLAVSATGFVSSVYLLSSFWNFPREIPEGPSGVIDLEMSFIASVLSGVNKWRSNIILYKDPQLMGQKFLHPTLPLLFTAGLCAMGAGYDAASVLIGWMNCVASAALSYYMFAHLTQFPLYATVCFICNSGWAFFRHALGNCPDGDLVRNVCGRCPVAWYQTLGYFLCFSKSASYTIPMALVVMLFIQMVSERGAQRYYLLAGVVLVLIPSPGVSIGVLLMATCYPSSFRTFAPFCVCIIFKMIGLRIKSFPIWREAQMQGVFFSPCAFLHDAFGPLSFGLWLWPLAVSSIQQLHRLAVCFAALIFHAFFRIGNGQEESILCITSVMLPMVACLFVDAQQDIERSLTSQASKGIFLGIRIVITWTVILGFAISLNRMRVIEVLSGDDIELGKWLLSNVPRKARIITDCHEFIPATVIAGRQILCGDVQTLWRGGSNVTAALRIINEMERTKNVINVMNRLKSHFVLSRIGDALSFITNETNLTVLFSNKHWTLYTNR